MPTIIAIVIALVAVAVAIAAWFKPAPKVETPAAKTYSEQETADAKKAVCDAFEKVRKTLSTTGGKLGDSPTDSFVVAVNIRLALETSSAYLARSLSDHLAAPDDLAKPVRNLAGTYQEIALNQLADASPADLDPLAQSADAQIAKIKRGV